MLLLTAAEMRALDTATIAAGRVTGAELMERAGFGLALAAVKHFGSPVALRVLVLAGHGNNGGDGFVAARHLKVMGARVGVGVITARDKVRADALLHLERLEADGVHVEFVGSDTALVNLTREADRWDWAIDALLGTGARGEPGGLVPVACESLRLLRGRGTRIIAADLPTGVSADDGSAGSHAVRADLTVTFGCLKRGHVLHPGRGLCGALELVDIGLLPAASAGVTGVTLAGPAEMAALLPGRDPRAHKGSAGRVLVVGGAIGMAGAVILASRAASRGGAGYVRVAAPARLFDVLASQLVEQMPLPCGGASDPSLTPAALEQVLAEAERADAVALGPGLSRDPGAVTFVHEFIAKLDRPLVIDADALSAIAPPEGDVESFLRNAPGPRVLTPHLGEMARLTGLRPSDLEANRIDAAGQWAKRWGCVIVLKGAPTVVAAPDGRTSVNPTGNAGMATAGMGDVLTGAIAALLAQRLAPFDAARVAVFAHGAAGDIAAAEIAPIGLVASDVVERLPRALHGLSGAAQHN